MSQPDGNATAAVGQAATQLRCVQLGHGSKLAASPGASMGSSTRIAARNAIQGPNFGCTRTPSMLEPPSPATFPSSMKLSVVAPLMKGNTIVYRQRDWRIT